MAFSIRAFVDQQRELERSQLISIENWNTVFADAGYHPAHCSRLAQWQEIHEWCKGNIGEEHYAWAGNCFWFETAETAAWFGLKWS